MRANKKIQVMEPAVEEKNDVTNLLVPMTGFVKGKMSEKNSSLEKDLMNQ